MEREGPPQGHDDQKEFLEAHEKAPEVEAKDDLVLYRKRSIQQKIRSAAKVLVA